MTKEAFQKKWQEILEADCKRTSNPNNRTLWDNEALNICNHLYEWLESYRTEFSADDLARIMVATSGRFQSFQDWAHAIVKLLNAKPQPKTK